MTLLHIQKSGWLMGILIVGSLLLCQYILERYVFGIELLIDITSMGAFIDDRRMYIVKQGEPTGNSEGIVLTSGGDNIIHDLKISEMKSIWK